MSADAARAEDVASWIGRERTVQDDITAVPLDALCATLDRDDPPFATGTPVPPLWHWLYFLALPRPAEMRSDGHAQGGEFMPPIALPRRVWAGSQFAWDPANPLRVGDRVTRVSRIASITPKAGSSGELVFVKTVHEFHNQRGLCLTNDHLSAFRGEARSTSGAAPAQAQEVSAWHRVLVPDPVLLFRFSALMFNSHRIHFDHPYATGQEKYAGLLVQGPLIATLLMDLLRREAPAAVLRSLELRAVRPSFVDRPLHLRGQPQGDAVHLWAADDEGRLAMTALARLQT